MIRSQGIPPFLRAATPYRTPPQVLWTSKYLPLLLAVGMADNKNMMRFTCQAGCTRCCEQRGWVWLSEEDVRRAAAFLRLPVAEFERRFIVRTRHRIRLRKPRGRQCHFLEEGKGCTIHPAKPTQCRLFPFWPELVENREAWKATGDFCPGIGKGPLIQIGTAMEMASGMRKAYPEQYGS